MEVCKAVYCNWPFKPRAIKIYDIFWNLDLHCIVLVETTIYDVFLDTNFPYFCVVSSVKPKMI